jgi:hypothetical protein
LLKAIKLGERFYGAHLVHVELDKLFHKKIPLL